MCIYTGIRVLRDCASKAGDASLITIASLLEPAARSWEGAEAVLFAAGSISLELLYSPAAKPGLDRALPALFGFAVRTDSAITVHPLVVQSTVRLASVYASWLNQNTEAVFGVLKYVLGIACTADDGSGDGFGMAGGGAATSAVGDAGGVGALASKAGSVLAMTTAVGEHAQRSACLLLLKDAGGGSSAASPDSSCI